MQELRPLLPQYIEKYVEKNIKIIAFKIGNSTSTNTSFNKIREIYENHKWKIGDIGQLFDIYDFKRGSTEEISNHFKELVIKAAVVAAHKQN